MWNIANPLLFNNEIRPSKTHIFCKRFLLISAVQQAYHTRYKNENARSRSVILNIVSVFEKTASIVYMPPMQKEQRKKREDTKNQLEIMVKDFPSPSIRIAASAIGVSPTLVYLTHDDNLHLKPYKYQQWTNWR